MKQYELPGQSDKEVPCYDHPDAPHGFNRNASHAEGRYVCECEGWHDELVSDDELKMLREDIDTLTDVVKSMSNHVLKLDDTVTRLTLEMTKIKENEDD